MGTGTHGTAGVYPAKYAFTTNGAACSDFVVFPTSGTGSATVPNIIAYNELYDTTCNSGNPTQFWAASFEIGTTYGTVTTSPVLSVDGSEVAFMAIISGKAYLVVLLMPSGDASTVTSFTCPSSTNVNNTGATATPQAWCGAFGDAHIDTRSSPFYDYANNLLYVGDDTSYLHKFQNVFHTYGIPTIGTFTNTTAPSEITTSPWPVQIESAAEELGSPVYDAGSGNVFVGQGWSSGNPASLASVKATSGALTVSSSTLGGAPIATPLVDSSAAKVYAFIGNDNSSSCTRVAGSTACSAVYQFSTTGLTSSLEARVGTCPAAPGRNYTPAPSTTFISTLLTTQAVCTFAETQQVGPLCIESLSRAIPWHRALSPRAQHLPVPRPHARRSQRYTTRVQEPTMTGFF